MEASMKQRLGERLADGSRIGQCPSCHKLARISLEHVGGLPADVPPAIIVHARHTRAATCATTLNRDMNVSDVAALCGVKTVTIYAAVTRGKLQATRRPGWPITFDVLSVKAYFERDDARFKRGYLAEVEGRSVTTN
jgi:hypothetical protein